MAHNEPRLDLSALEGVKTGDHDMKRSSRIDFMIEMRVNQLGHYYVSSRKFYIAEAEV